MKKRAVKQHICVECGKEYFSNGTYCRFCSRKCASSWHNRKWYAEHKAKREMERELEEEKKHAKSTLQMKIEESRAAGLSYGKYVAMIEAKERSKNGGIV